LEKRASRRRRGKNRRRREGWFKRKGGRK